MERGRLVTARGTVVENKMNKTIVVRSEIKVKHPVYGKYVRRFTKYYAHDEKGEAGKGDFVELAATRPMSKLKRWRLVRIVTRSTAVEPVAGAGRAEGEVKG